MHYYLSPLSWDGESFHAPDGSCGMIDLRSIPHQSIAGDLSGVALVWSRELLRADGSVLLGSGDCREIKPARRSREAWGSIMSVQPQGDTLADMIFDHLLNGDPLGLDRCKPLMPNRYGHLCLWMSGHGRGPVHYEPFLWGRHRASNRIKSLIQADFLRTYEIFGGGDHPRRVLDWHCHRHQVADWKEFSPKELHREIVGRLPHATAYSDDFNRANETPLTTPWNLFWVPAGSYNLTSNVMIRTAADGNSGVRYDSALSGADHFSQCTQPVLVRGGPLCRQDGTTAATFYLIHGQLGSQNILTRKSVATVHTTISTDSVTVANNDVIKLECDGSDLTATHQGTDYGPFTDTTISAGSYAGVTLQQQNNTADNWSAEDLGAAPGGAIVPQMIQQGLYAGGT